MQEQSRLTFRITIWRPWLLAISPLVLLAAVAIVPSLIAGKLAIASGFLIALAVVAVLLLLLISWTVRVSRWHIGPEGVGGPNNQLAYHWLRWSEIESVQPWLIPGYRYGQIKGGGRRWAFWLPLFLTDMPGLRSAVAQYAPPGNPLRRFLEEHPS